MIRHKKKKKRVYTKPRRGGSFPRRIRCCNFDWDFTSVKEAAEVLGISDGPIKLVLNYDSKSNVCGLTFMWIDI